MSPVFAAFFLSAALAAPNLETTNPEEGEFIEVPAPERPARGDSPEPRTGVPLHPPGKLSLTVSVFHLVALFPELTLEVRPSRFFSVAATGGAMRFLDGTNLQEYGGQARYYPEGRGFHLGVEGFWARIHMGEANGWLDHVTVHPYGGGPFVGHKSEWRDGVTIDFQVGMQAIATADSPGEWTPFPILNLNIGKSW